MLTPLATLAFLAAIWVAVTFLFETFAGNGSKIVAALKGHSQLAARPTIVPVPVRLTQRSRMQRPMRAEPRWRAAA